MGVLPGGWYSGLGLAVLAFAVTRLLVASSLEPDTVSFAVAGVVPLVAGLALTLVGVALAVGAVSRSYVRSVWLWSGVGTAAATVVLATSAVHSILTGRGMTPLLASGPLVGNAILGGTLAGAVVGDRAARRRRRQDDLARYAERATLVNRVLRHEVTNAATVLKGYADYLRRTSESERPPAAEERGAADGSTTGGGHAAASARPRRADAERSSDALGGDRAGDWNASRAASADDRRSAPDRRAGASTGSPGRTGSRAARNATGSPVGDRAETVTAIHDAAERVERTVDRIGTFATAEPERHAIDAVAVVAAIARDPPGAVELSVDRAVGDAALVYADDRLELLLRELVESVAENGPRDAPVELSVGRATAPTGGPGVRLTIRSDGEGFPSATCDLLETPGLPERDDPRLRYGLQMVRLLVDHYDGAIDVGREETVVAVTLQRAAADRVAGLERGVPFETLSRAAVAGLGAAVASGLVLQAFADGLSTVGALYGAANVVVGGVAHAFHSVLFAFLYAAALEHGRVAALATDRRRRTALGVGCGVTLWVVAASLLLPLGLLAANVESDVPAWRVDWLVVHVLWGALLGRWTTSGPTIGDLSDGLRRRVAGG